MRILAIGSCLLEDLLHPRNHADSDVEIDFVLSGLLSELPTAPPADIAVYDCQVLQIALRPLLPDNLLFQLPAADEATQKATFATTRSRMRQYVRAALKWNMEHGTTTYVMNFMQPQFNLMGRFQPRFSLANIEYYVLRLNQALEHLVAEFSNCFILDIDRIAASFGRRFLQDDPVGPTNHNARLLTHARMDGRIEYVGQVSETYEIQPNDVLRTTVLAEIPELCTAHCDGRIVSSSW